MVLIDSSFEGGNIEVVDANSFDDIRLKIRKDTKSDFFQWFAFRLIGARNKPCVLKILNAAQASFPSGWEDYRAVKSSDKCDWQRVPTSFKNGILEIKITPDSDAEYLSYFAMYPSERHANLVAKCQASPDVSLSVPGFTVRGRPLEVLRFDDETKKKPAFWIIARQHPGETMAEWFMEGLLLRLLDKNDGAVRSLLEKTTIYAIPNMNPDGSALGNLRVNAEGINLNREWENPKEESSPEVYYARQMMIDTGIKFCLDVHGDEGLPYNFIAGFEGIAEASAQQLELLDAYRNNLAKFNGDFQTTYGYPKVQRGKGMKTTATGYFSAYHGAVAMTLEMPFKDAKNAPDEKYGWSPSRSMALGRSTVEAILSIVDEF
ncbi:MAG: hypothetical protein CMM15_09790 [Rhodospirillaceae bacterium]|nr:hypothetical protein [Rhodospirillaceae bacterium]OUU22402.1 MAG: hypothetical protein CBB97_15300 [Candidatus Endolissoclinum sp. TMED37]